MAVLFALVLSAQGLAKEELDFVYRLQEQRIAIKKLEVTFKRITLECAYAICEMALERDGDAMTRETLLNCLEKTVLLLSKDLPDQKIRMFYSNIGVSTSANIEGELVIDVTIALGLEEIDYHVRMLRTAAITVTVPAC